MRLGYLAIDQHGGKIALVDPKRGPRAQLLEKMGRKSCQKMYCDPDARHIGYIVGGRWFTIYEVHPWEGKKE